MFAKNQKIVCVDDQFSPEAAHMYVKLPEKGVVYTVRGMYIGRGNALAKDTGKMEGEIGILLEEIRNPHDPGLKKGLNGELGFKAERFAPLDTVPPKKETESTDEPADGETWEQFEERKYGRRNPEWDTATHEVQVGEAEENPTWKEVHF